jgi:endonuclease/exonuclease/phosphatase family metal-dependent hydrolase
MPPDRILARRIVALAIVLAASLGVIPPANALRIVNHNITNYPGLNLAGRQPHFRTIQAALSADVVVCQEVQSQAGVDSFLTNVLNVVAPGQWAAAPFFNGNDTDNALFYRPAAVQLLGAWPFYPNPANLLRYVVCYRLKPVGYNDAAAELRIYSQHLKASTGFEAQRLAEATGIRDSMNAMPPGTHAILEGDFNIYTGAEPAFGKLRESQANNVGRVYDPLNAPLVTWNTPSLAPIHTQSPCASCPSGFATGGLDDRFDMFLPTLNLSDGEGLDLLVSTYKPVGNDGLHYNLNITDPPTIAEGAAYASALWNASDHLPIRVDLQVPAKIDVPAALALGAGIGGIGAPLPIGNPAVIPADELNLSFTPPAGFTAPAGPQTVNAGTPVSFPIATAPGPAGHRAGDLAIASDDPDRGTVQVALSADVFDHAVASLDSTNVTLTGLLDFGEHASGEFPTLLARVHNAGYHPFQARLAVTGAAFAGGDDRFSLVGTFVPGLVGAVAQSYAVAFDEAGATQDSTYEGTLTFASADEALPGAASQPDLVLTLRARVGSGTTAADQAPPTTTRLLAPFPNPVSFATSVRFDLARPGPARLEVFDLAGRRVASLADREFAPGRYTLRWNPTDASGARLGSGLYFVRLSVPGQRPDVARVVLAR